MVTDTNWSPKTILVVEDAEAIRRMVCTMLSQSGYSCLEASNGQEALRLLEHTDDVHLLLTDVIMPKMGGAELARHVSHTRPHVRIVFMSGYSDDQWIQSVEGVPGLFLPKPFTADALCETVRQSLEGPWCGLPQVKTRSSRHQ